MCGGTQFFPLLIRENFVLGYRVFSLNIKEVAAVFIIQAQFFSLNNKGKISDWDTVFPLNIRDELPNSVIFYQTTVDREIFTLKIIRGLNFCVKNISSLDGSAT